jgi:hypothetical protein
MTWVLRTKNSDKKSSSSSDASSTSNKCSSFSSEPGTQIRSNGTINGIWMYPNPVLNQFTIQSKENISFEKLYLYDSKGVNIKQIKVNQLSKYKVLVDLPYLPSGVYILSVQSGNKLENLRWIKL